MGNVITDPSMTESAWLRFWTKVDTGGPCWEWTGARGRHGYGNFGDNGKTWRAHRWAYERLVGQIAAGLTLDHLCRNRACVNPDHLDPCTQQANNSRVPNFGHRPKKMECKWGHSLSGDNLYVQKKTGYRYCRTCSNARRTAYMERRRSAEAVHIVAPGVQL